MDDQSQNERSAANGFGKRTSNNQLSAEHISRASNERQELQGQRKEPKRALAWSSGQSETFGRIRLGEMRKVSHWRYGQELPDDDAGREELNLRFKVISLRDFPEVRMKREAEIYAPWMTEAEVDDAIQQVMREPAYMRMMTAELLGQQPCWLGLERATQAHDASPIRPTGRVSGMA